MAILKALPGAIYLTKNARHRMTSCAFAHSITIRDGLVFIDSVSDPI